MTELAADGNRVVQGGNHQHIAEQAVEGWAEAVFELNQFNRGADHAGGVEDAALDLA